MNRPDLVQSRRRLDRQETLSFQPLRQPVHQRPEPYDRPDAAASRDSAPARPPPDSDEALFGQVFTIDDVDPAQLPDGRSVVMDISTW